MLPGRVTQIGSLATVLVLISGCKSTSCTEVITCVDGVTVQFEPTIVVRQEVVVTFYDEDASYSGVYSLPSQLTGPLNLITELDIDAGTAILKSATLTAQTPSKITYSVIADGATVAQGAVTPAYRTVSKGPSADCRQSCTQAEVTIPVSQ